MTGVRFLHILIVVLLLICPGVRAQQNFKSLVNTAYDSSSKGQYIGALSLLYKAAALKGIDTGYNDGVYMYIGGNYESLEKMDSALYYYGEALRYFESQKDYESLSFICNRLGAAELNYMKRYEKSIDYFKRQIHYYVLQKDSTYIFGCYNNIGLAYKALNRYDSALFYFNYVMHSKQAAEETHSIAFLQTADVYSLQKKYKDALSYYDKAITRLSGLQDSLRLFIAYISKGDCLMTQGLFSKSLSSLRKASDYLTGAVSNNDKKNLYHNLSFVYANLKNYKSAFYYKSLEDALKDSINIGNIQKAATEAEAKYSVRRTQDSLLLSKQQLTLSESVAATRQRNFIIAVILAIVVSLLAFLFLRNAQARKKMNTRLSVEKQKVESLATELKGANDAKTKLFSIISHDLRSPISSLYGALKLQEVKSAIHSTTGVSAKTMHLLDTLEDLLIWSKSQMDKFTVQPVTAHIHELYMELTDLYRDVAHEKNVTINDETTENISVITDENLMKTILRNVLSNAIKHTAPGSTITLNAEKMDSGAICIISNNAMEADFRLISDVINNPSLDSGMNGLGVYLIKELSQSLNIIIEMDYNNDRIDFKLLVPHLKKS